MKTRFRLRYAISMLIHKRNFEFTDLLAQTSTNIWINGVLSIQNITADYAVPFNAHPCWIFANK